MTGWPQLSPPLYYSLYTSRQMEALQKPEGLKEDDGAYQSSDGALQKPEGLKDYRQAVERSGTPAKADDNISPERAAESSATPSGFSYTPLICRGSASLHRLPVISTPLRGSPTEMCIKSS